MNLALQNRLALYRRRTHDARFMMHDKNHRVSYILHSASEFAARGDPGLHPAGTGIDIAYAIGLPPEKAIEYFKSKGYAMSWDWQDVWQEAHKLAFTVAKAMRMDVLQTIRDEMQKVFDEGISLDQFRKDLEPRLKALGWWGKQMVADETGATSVQLGSPYRLRTIYNTNTQVAYNVGRERFDLENMDDRPYWRYVAVLDAVTRPAHRALHGKVFRADDPFWNSFYPPNGWNCRCRVQALSARDVVRRGLTVESSEGLLSSRDALVSKATGEMRPVTVYTDPQTGRQTAPDVGWSYNPGKTDWSPDLNQYDKDIAKLF